MASSEDQARDIWDDIEAPPGVKEFLRERGAGGFTIRTGAGGDIETRAYVNPAIPKEASIEEKAAIFLREAAAKHPSQVKEVSARHLELIELAAEHQGKTVSEFCAVRRSKDEADKMWDDLAEAVPRIRELLRLGRVTPASREVASGAKKGAIGSPVNRTERTEYVNFRVSPADIELLQTAANHEHKTVSQFCRDIIFRALDQPEEARHVEVMSALATICEKLEQRKPEPENPYAGLDIEEVEAKLQRIACLESNVNNLKFGELNEFCDLRDGLVGSLYAAWKERGMTGVKLAMSGR